MRMRIEIFLRIFFFENLIGYLSSLHPDKNLCDFLFKVLYLSKCLMANIEDLPVSLLPKKILLILVRVEELDFEN